jgi:hypothetical protein
MILSFSLTSFLSSLNISFLFHYVIYVVLSHYVIYFVLSHYVFYFVSNVSNFLMMTTFNRIKFRWLVLNTSSNKLLLIIIHLMFDLNLSRRFEQKQREKNDQSKITRGKWLIKNIKSLLKDLDRKSRCYKSESTYIVEVLT